MAETWFIKKRLHSAGLWGGFFGIAAAMVLAALGGCGGLGLDPLKEGAGGGSGGVTVNVDTKSVVTAGVQTAGLQASLAASGLLLNTAIPTENNGNFDFEYWFNPVNTPDVDSDAFRRTPDPETGKFTLPAGEYIVKVKGFKKDSGGYTSLYIEKDMTRQIAEGTATLTVTSNGSGTVTVPLSPIITEGGKGDFDYTVNYPSGAEITQIYLVSKNDSNYGTYSNYTTYAGVETDDEDTDVKRRELKKDIPAGYYSIW